MVVIAGKKTNYKFNNIHFTKVLESYNHLRPTCIESTTCIRPNIIRSSDYGCKDYIFRVNFILPTTSDLLHVLVGHPMSHDSTKERRPIPRGGLIQVEDDDELYFNRLCNMVKKYTII